MPVGLHPLFPHSSQVSRFGGNATRTPGAVPALSDEVSRFRGEGVGRDVVVRRFGRRFQGFAGGGRAATSLLPVRTKVSRVSLRWGLDRDGLSATLALVLPVGTTPLGVDSPRTTTYQMPSKARPSLKKGTALFNVNLQARIEAL
jgi:hypothetical protein